MPNEGSPAPAKFIEAIEDLGGSATVAQIKIALAYRNNETVLRYMRQARADGLVEYDSDKRTISLRRQEPGDMSAATKTAEPTVAELKTTVDELSARLKRFEEAGVAPAAAVSATDAPAVPPGASAGAAHGLCQDAKCASCVEQSAKVRDGAAHEIAHGIDRIAQWAGLEAEWARVKQASERFIAAGQPAEGTESAVDQLVGAR